MNRSRGTILFVVQITFITVLAVIVRGQMVTMSPLDISPPTVFADVKVVKASNPKMTSADLVDAANTILAKKGIAFTFSFDDATCVAIDKAIKSLKNPPPKVNLKTKLRSVGAEVANLTLPPAEFSNNECSKCSVTLPVLELTEKDFVALMLGNNIKFHLPTNLAVGEVMLVDDKDLTVVKKKWRVPYRSAPLGVSYDENVLYLALPDPELKELSLAVFGEGVFQFATREEAESNGKATPVKEFTKDAARPEVAATRFENRGLKQVVKYSNPCGR